MIVNDATTTLDRTFVTLDRIHSIELVGLVSDLNDVAVGVTDTDAKTAIEGVRSEVCELKSMCSRVMATVGDAYSKLTWLYEQGDETDAETSDKGKAPSDSTSADSGDSEDCIAVTTKQLDEYDAAIDKLSFLAVVLGNLQPVGGDRADAGLFFVLTDAISVFEDMAPKLKGLPRVPSTEV